MDIKLVALDLDGTLLNSKKQISDRNAKALAACIERGIHVVPSTGRTLNGIPKEFRCLPGVRYAIALNGGMVIDLEQNHMIYEKKLDHPIAMEILDIVSHYHVMYDAYINGTGISEARFYNHLEEYHIPKEIQKLVKLTRQIVPDIIDHVRQYGKAVEKINLFFSSLDDRKVVRQILSGRNDIVITSSLDNNLEINALGATKGEGLAHLADYLEVNIEETMACGDGENDVTIIKAAGIGVVMANGEDCLRAIADYVTAGNDEDGVAQAIEHFVLSQ